MREHKNITETVERQGVCVLLKCDACGKAAECPEDGLWEWGGVGTAQGQLTASMTIDGDHSWDSVDLCYECASKIIDDILCKRYTNE